tara:strand:+ start:1007 stop:3133 length:2127 start_codon:yes stop_codon:yes gene_type:complete
MADRTLAEIAAAAKELNKESSKIKVDEVVASSGLPEEQKLNFAQDLMTKITPIAGWASDKVESFTEDEYVKEVTDETIRALGLTARAGGEGAASLFGIIYDPLAVIVNLGSKIVGGEGNIPAFRTQVSKALDDLGVPEPQNATERVVDMISQGMVAGGGTVSVAKKLANFLSGVSKKVATIMASGPGSQVVAGGSAGAGSQVTAEMGGGPVAQTAAALASGLVGGKVANVKTDPIPEQTIATAKQAESAGLPVLTSDVRPPSTFAGKWLQRTGESIPLLGTGGIRKTQQDLRTEAVKDLARSFGVNLRGDIDIIEEVAKDLKRKRGGDLTRFTSLKKSVIDDLKTKGNVDVSRTVAAIDQEIARLSSLKSKGVNQAIEILNDWRGSVLGKTVVKGADGKETIINEGQNLENIEQLRKFLGQSFEDSNLASVKQLGQESLNRIYNPLREDMRSFIQNFGNKNDIKKFDIANARLSEMAGELDVNVFKNVLKKGEATPEEINKILFSKKPSDIKLLYKNLDSTGKANARTAIISDMFKKSLNADESISPDVFKNQIKQRSEQLGIFFNEKDLNAVQGLGRILSLTRRGAEANVLPPTGAMLQIPVISGFLMQSLGGVGGGAVAVMSIGGIARILESPAVRNILVKLPKVSAGSTQEAELMKRLDDILILESGSPSEDENYLSTETSGALQNIIGNIKPSTINKVITQSSQ